MSTPIACIEDLRRLAQRRVPRAIFEYVDRGSYDEVTLRANRRDLEAIALRQRVAVDVEHRSTATTLVGEPATMPVAIAPTGLTGLNWGNGEMLAARAAQRFGVPFTLSTMSICSIEDVAAFVDQPFWFQLYVMRDRGFAASLIERARAANCSALVLTLDLQVQGQRHRDLKNGLAVPPRLTLANALDVASKPAWALRVLAGKRKSFGNLDGYVKGADTLATLSQWIAGQFDPTLSWADVEWVRKLWAGKLILKGILDVEDARIAASTGCDAIVVSNHGGRQLDGAISSIRALPEIVQAVGDRTEVLFDGGVRSGQDVLKAVALGARGCLIGRAFLYGLGAMGEAGVTTALELIRRELDVSMALSGTRDVREASPALLRLPDGWRPLPPGTPALRQAA
ncbi:L-lactate dehydrogenase (cytochrome) [Caldimonas thermodepolymerans]|uniref:L-lactate dehydrogenase (Cytochrome) n=1 Tax=Caldimonas thermodepolymerans TaxID=215580 RepID=A0AA46DGF2_9BURK|nr:alpha-hydroxy acid oxidase [Caldimonas thermodepolymerans]TCP08762.1 L-lactate dehydrogenase (cytochrome) [Caldimonas thermodepolymerans]